jgi:hypothetical protein
MSNVIPLLDLVRTSVSPLLGPTSNPFAQASSQTPKFLSSAQTNSQNITNKLIQDQVQEAEMNTGSVGFTSNIATFDKAKEGSLAMEAKPTGNGLVDIVSRFPWTISNTRRSDIPYIYLVEHKVEGGSIQKQLAFYAAGVTETAADYVGAGETKNILDVYKEIFVPNPTGFKYKFPYFTKISYEINTTPWQQFDKIGGSISDIGGGLGMFGKVGAAAGLAAKTMTAVGEMAKVGLKASYPVVGVADRPRIFTSHSERSITIEFPLFNTVSENDWKRNKDFIQLFKGQNLFNKRNFITGLPPVWYKVQVPGQYYSVASCVTNFTVENLGNTRAMFVAGKRFIVPDAYQVKITLQEMAMPSKNQFQASFNSGMADADSKVSVSTAEPPATPFSPGNEATNAAQQGFQ